MMTIDQIKKALAECQGLTELTNNQAMILWNNLPTKTKMRYINTKGNKKDAINNKANSDD